MQQPRTSTASTGNSVGSHQEREAHLPQTDFNEIALLEHFCSQTFPSLGFSQSMSATTCLDLANHAPYLRLQLLATSASHLSLSQPARKDTSMDQANALRGAAISSYLSVALELDSATAPALLLFSSLLATQKLLDASISERRNYNSFFEHLLLFMDVQRGVCLIVHRS